jgi:hypothetical protein
LKQTTNVQITTAGTSLDKKLGGIEEEIYQVRNRSSQDPLNFPIKLNNKIGALQGTVESSESRPTDQSYTVFAELSGKLQVELEALKQVFDKDLAAFNEMLRNANLKPIEKPGLRKPVI